MDEIKGLLFHIMLYRLFRGVAKYIVYGNTCSSFGWLRSLHATTGREGRQNQVENDQLGQNQELVPKQGTTSVAWTCVFKHCSFKTIDFKPLKHKQQSYMLAPSLFLCESKSYWLLNDYINTYMRQNPRLCKYPHKHSDLGLKGIVHFEIKIWYLSAYPKGIQDVGVFFLQ